MPNIQARLDALNITLPVPPTPLANYVPFTKSGKIVHISGQLSNDGSGKIKGTIGVDLTIEDGIEAARLCGVNLLAQMQVACGGDLENLVRVLKLNAFVQAGPDFYDIPIVINGCSDLMFAVLGEAGKHARCAVGMYKLPFGFAVEIDAIIEVK